MLFDGSTPRAAAVIRKTAARVGAPCREISKNAFEILEVHRNDIAFSRRNAYDRDVIWHVPLCGAYQVMNTEIALEAAEELLKDEEIHRKRWPGALAAVKWEGRMEQAARPFVVVDGAHNPWELWRHLSEMWSCWKEISPGPGSRWWYSRRLL